MKIQKMNKIVDTKNGKKENADIINSKEIANLEKMLEHKDRNKK